MKQETEADWLLAMNFTPLEGEIILYKPDEAHSEYRMKIGDGKTNVNELPFFMDDKIKIVTWEADD